jgi:hypothetical protein
MTARVVALAIALSATALLAQRAQTALPPATPGTAELQVLITSDEQTARPMRRASVSVQAGELGVPRTAMTDDDGRVVFSGLAAGNYLLSASKPGYVRIYYGSRSLGMGPGVAVALTGGARQEIRMKLVRGAVLTGVVRTPAGRPAANIMMQGISRRGSFAREVSFFAESANTAIMTDDRGVYRIFGLPPGEYVVTARSGFTREEVRVLTDQELQWVDRQIGGTAGSAPPDPASAPPMGPRSSFAPVYYPGTTIASEAGVVSLGPGEERGGLDFTLQLVPTAQIRGRLLDESGRPQSNQSITLRGNQQGVAGDMLQILESAFGGASAQTGPDGSFTLNAIRPGRYTIGARGTPRSEAEAAPGARGRAGGPPSTPETFNANRAQTHWASEDVTIAGVDLSDITLVFRPGMNVSGRIVYEATTLTPPKDMSTVSFMLSPAQTNVGVIEMAMSAVSSSQVRVNADGTFSASGLAPGRYRLLTQAAVLSTVAPTAVAAAGGFVLKSAMVGNRDVADAPFEIKPGQDVTGVVVTFSDRPTEISGTVFDQAGRVTPDFPIVIFSTDRAYWAAASRRVQLVRPSSDGKFRAVGLPAGEYFVCAVTAIEQEQLGDTAFLSELAAASFKLTLRDGEKKVQDLKLGGG